MKHLIVCREYPPASGGGIGTYVHNIARLLAESGETVHVIGQLCEQAGKAVEEECGGKLIVHRVRFEESRRVRWSRASSPTGDVTARALAASDLPSQGFSWEAGALADRLVDEEGIDVIETQEYEAPLYYFQLRRTLGLGARRRPPCIVHLHSPTEFIARHNDWNVGHARWATAMRLERYAISTADALLCPSRYLASQAEAHFELPKDSIEIIPYPLGTPAVEERSRKTWEEGSVCYIGRMERRKGVLELLAAAVRIAEQYPAVRFEFIGANVLDSNMLLSEALLDRLIPRHLRARFVFHGQIDRSAIPRYLERARLAVVPSRWENFPNTCVEAMASGLPVLASPTGGMAEVIADGRNGWVADAGDEAGLARALRRALETPPRKIAEMGEDAARSIRAYCDNRTVVERHLRFRGEVVDRGSHRSTKSTHAVGNSSALQVLSEQIGENAKRIDTRPPYSDVRSGGRRLRERTAAMQCLVANPRVALRVWKRITARLSRRASRTF